MASSGRQSLKGVRVLHLAAADSMLNPNLRDQLIFLREEGCEVSTASIDGPLARRLRNEDGFPWTPLPLSREFAPFSDLTAVRFIQNFCREKRFDIVHTHTPKGNLIGQWGARLAGTPVVLQTLHGFYFHDRMGKIARQAWIEIERFSARHSDHILCQNPEDVETALQERIVDRARITEMGNGIDLERFVPVDEAGRRTAQVRLGFPAEARVIGMVGRFVAEKGFPEFLEAARILSQRHKDVFFLAIGHQVSSERHADRFVFDVSNISRQDLLSNRLKVLTDRHDMPELYAAMDINVLPSHREGFPRALIEGAACGLAQVATDIRGCRQAIMNGQTGLLSQPKNSLSLAENLDLLLKNEALKKNMGRLARKLALEKFDRKRVFEILKRCYEKLLGI